MNSPVKNARMTSRQRSRWRKRKGPPHLACIRSIIASSIPSNYTTTQTQLGSPRQQSLLSQTISRPQRPTTTAGTHDPIIHHPSRPVY